MRSRLGPIAQQRERNARLEAQARQIAARDEAEGAKVTADRVLPVVMLPANTRDSEPLPLTTRSTFLERLRTVMQAAFEHPVRDNSQPMSAQEEAERIDARDASGASQTVRLTATTDSFAARSAVSAGQSVLASAALLGAGCATCRGECCTAGGTHAFLGEDSLVRVRAQFHEDGQTMSCEALLEEYAAHLPTRHYRGSCVYHTLQGCALPRGLRSNLCNRYVCGGLTQLTRALDASELQQAYVAAADSVHLRRMALITPTRTRVLSLKGSGIAASDRAETGSADLG